MSQVTQTPAGRAVAVSFESLPGTLPAGTLNWGLGNHPAQVGWWRLRPDKDWLREGRAVPDRSRNWPAFRVGREALA